MPLRHPGVWLAVALGGAAGALMRYGVDRLVNLLLPARWPIGTWLVNVSGAALAGWLAGNLFTGALDPAAAMVLSAGFAGSYTTFSGWMVQTLMLMQREEYAAAAGNVVLHLVPGYMLCMMAYRLAVGY